MLPSPHLFVPGFAHLIVQRGAAVGRMFFAEQDFCAYMEDLAEQRALLEVRVFAYCLMTDHVLLVAQPERCGADLQSLMWRLGKRHAAKTGGGHAGTDMNGHLACSVLDSDDRLLRCCRYVELSPVRASIVQHPEEYRWSSYRVRAGYAAPDGCQDLDAAYLLLGRNDPERQARYREFVATGMLPGAATESEACAATPSGTTVVNRCAEPAGSWWANTF